MMDITKRVGEAVEHIYMVYGGDSGHLFGIPLELKYSVQLVVELVVEMFEADEQIELTDKTAGGK